ncbi:MAG: hypothetical protein IPL26_28060 [Leptospiraceae bacterium]|nr:hypothetical protein [Leptospiraceae bacterium]
MNESQIISDRKNMKNLLTFVLFFSILSLSGQDNKEKPAIDQSKIAVSVPGPGSGLGDAAWGNSYVNIRDKIMAIRNTPEIKEKIEIVNEVKDKSLLVKRNNITYLYRFYKKPKILEKFNKSKEDEGKSSSLFSVGVYFSPVESIKLKKQVEDKYGKATKEPQAQIPKDKFSKPDDEEDDSDTNNDDKKIAGAYIWSFLRNGGSNPDSPAPAPKEAKTTAEASANTQPSPEKSNKSEFIIQWVEPYNKKAFSKRMDYFSVDRTDLINIDYKDYFSARETDVLLDLVTEGVYQDTDKNKGNETEVTPNPAKVAPAKN